jgi:hypothetical protein
VVAFGAIAEQAFLRWQGTTSGKRFTGHFEPITHPTMPDATARPGSANYRAATKRLLDEWNAGLARLDEALGSNRDRGNTPQIIERQGPKAIPTPPGAQAPDNNPEQSGHRKGASIPEWYCG